MTVHVARAFLIMRIVARFDRCCTRFDRSLRQVRPFCRIGFDRSALLDRIGFDRFGLLNGRTWFDRWFSDGRSRFDRFSALDGRSAFGLCGVRLDEIFVAWDLVRDDGKLPLLARAGLDTDRYEDARLDELLDLLADRALAEARLRA